MGNKFWQQSELAVLDDKINVLREKRRMFLDLEDKFCVRHSFHVMQYRVILHDMRIEKYCCRNINWIVQVNPFDHVTVPAVVAALNCLNCLCKLVTCL